MRSRKDPVPGYGEAPLRTIVLATLALVPIVVSRATFDSSELPKSLVLIIAALVIAGWTLGTETARLLTIGAGAWIRSAGRLLRSRLSGSPVNLAVAALVGSAVISTITSINPGLSFRGAPESYAGLVVVLAVAVVYYGAGSLPGTPSAFSRICVAAVIATSCAVAYALVQLAGLDPIVWGRRAAFGGTFRVFGTLGHPNHLAAYLVMTLPLIAFLGVRARSFLPRAALAVLAACSLTVILATLSRGAWMGLLVTTAIAVPLFRPERGRGDAPAAAAAARGPRASAPLWAAPFLILILALAILGIAGPSLRSDVVSRLGQIGSLSSPSTQTRLEIWRAAMKMFADRPALGVGVDAFSTAFPRFRTSRLMMLEWGGGPTKAHNEMIHTLATQGIAGGTAVLILVAAITVLAFRSIRHRRGDERRAAVAATAALAGFAVQDLVSFTVVATGSLAAALAGWLAAAARRPRGSARERIAPARSRTIGAAGILVAMLTAGPFLAQRWRSEVASFRAVRSAPGSRERIAALARAVEIAPWDSRFKSQLGREYLNLAVAEVEPARRWDSLESARGSLSLAVQEIAPEHAYDLACLGKTLAAEWSLRQDPRILSEMRAAFTGAVSYDPANAEVLLIAAEGYAEAGRDGESREIALRCAALYPDLAMPLAILGYQALREGRVGDAADTLSAALARDWRDNRPAEATSWNSLSAAYFETGRYEQAEDAARRALELEPRYQTADSNLRRAAAALAAERRSGK